MNETSLSYSVTFKLPLMFLTILIYMLDKMNTFLNKLSLNYSFKIYIKNTNYKILNLLGERQNLNPICC